MIYKSVFLAILASAASCGAEDVNVHKSSMNIINSETKPGNLLPNFLFQQGSIEGGSVGVKIGGGRGTPKAFAPDDSCGDDIFEGAMEDMRSPQLPYLTQDLWTCDRKSEDIDTVVMETDDLKVTITPQYAGKVWGIYDKKRERDILYSNRAHQPANIGALKSWAAGGAEWNWSPGIIGHSAFSETQVHLARVETERGSMVRVYEFDRYNGTVWQVDMIISNGTFYAHPRITNPTEKDLRGYWWTCVAVEAKPSTRIFAPATHVAETSFDPMRNAPWPIFAEAIQNASFKGYNNAWPTDNSYLGNHQMGDMFLRIPDSVYTPYIGHTQEDGYVLIHGHPLNGTKFFTWGENGPGRFMQDFLAGGGERMGDYTELQVGPAPTQMQNFAVPKNSIREWTEWFRGFDGDITTLRGDDYNAALSYVDEWIKSPDGVTRELSADWEKFFSSHATSEVSEVLVKGQPWGALEELRLGHPLVPGLSFQLPERDSLEYFEVQPWMELVQLGTFSEASLARLPLSYQTTDAWLELLQLSSVKYGMTWLHALHIGIALTERGEVDGSLLLFEQSMDLFPNPIAARCIGVLQTTSELAWPYLELAWNTLHSSFKNDVLAYDRLQANLVTEMSFFLQQAAWYDKMQTFIPLVPDAHRGIDAFVTMEIKLYMYQERFQEAKALLGKNCFPTYAKARSDLMALWNTVTEGIAQQKKGEATPLTIVEKHQARVSNPIPRNIGCQYATDYCTNYW